MLLVKHKKWPKVEVEVEARVAEVAKEVALELAVGKNLVVEVCLLWHLCHHLKITIRTMLNKWIQQLLPSLQMLSATLLK